MSLDLGTNHLITGSISSVPRLRIMSHTLCNLSALCFYLRLSVDLPQSCIILSYANRNALTYLSVDQSLFVVR